MKDANIERRTKRITHMFLITHHEDNNNNSNIDLEVKLHTHRLPSSLTRSLSISAMIAAGSIVPVSVSSAYAMCYCKRGSGEAA